MKKYKIIYADPPWRYARSKVQGAAEKHYPTMSIEELCALPVKEIADKDCILFLWATFPQLKEALQLIKAWGFTYKSVAFVWLKQNRKSPTWFYGLGFWTRGNAEICLLATKGHPKRQSNKVHQFIISPVEQHSKKPDITREKILEALRGMRQHVCGGQQPGEILPRLRGKDTPQTESPKREKQAFTDKNNYIASTANEYPFARNARASHRERGHFACWDSPKPLYDRERT